jgi:hypothetical protein
MQLTPSKRSGEFVVGSRIAYEAVPEHRHESGRSLWIVSDLDDDAAPLHHHVVDIPWSHGLRIALPSLAIGFYRFHVVPLNHEFIDAAPSSQKRIAQDIVADADLKKSFDSFNSKLFKDKTFPDWLADYVADHASHDRFEVVSKITRVELTKSEEEADAPTGPWPTYNGFVASLRVRKSTRALASLGLDAHPAPKFGGPPDRYDRLMDAARSYVTSCTCDDVTELFPPDYLIDQANQSIGWLKNDKPANEILPCAELIFCYWLEEGMLVQTLNHIVARFQNRRVSTGDPLARFDVSPLVPLRSLLWTWVENELRRLTVRRRAAEYQYEYGLALVGRAVPTADNIVERRSGFLAAFHTTLHLATKSSKSSTIRRFMPTRFRSTRRSESATSSCRRVPRTSTARWRSRLEPRCW